MWLKHWLAVLSFLLIFDLSVPLQAGTPAPFGRKTTVKTTRVAVQHIFLTQNRGRMFNLKIGQKLFSFLTLNSDLALGSQFRPYLGLDLHADLNINNLITLGLYAGQHGGGFGNGKDFGATLFIDPVQSLGFFLAFDVDEQEQDIYRHICIGLDMPLAKNMGFMASYERGLTKTPYQSFSSGFIFFF